MGCDCTMRQCSQTIAWADTADGTSQAHYYAECGNKGICDRATGECKCFEGYEGKGCRRMSCPNACSGRGTCEAIEDIARDFQDRRAGPGFKFKDTTGGHPWPSLYAGHVATPLPAKHHKVTGRQSFFEEMHNGYTYHLWDAKKIMICKCDLGYKGSDCSIREVPRGDDPLTIVKSEAMRQKIKISGTITGGEFFLRYHDPYGGSWVTDTAKVVGGGTNKDDASVAAAAQTLLRQLPNQVLEDVSVSNIPTGADYSICHRFYEGVQHISSHDITRAGHFHNSKQRTNFCEFEDATGLPPSDTSIDLMVSFSTKTDRSGLQYYIEVDKDPHPAGSFPVSKGIVGTSIAVSVAEINYNDNLGNLSELSPCSDRGLDDGDGQCECFDGFGGLSCENQNALV